MVLSVRTFAGINMFLVQFVIAALVPPQQGPDIQAGSRRFLHFSIYSI